MPTEIKRAVDRGVKFLDVVMPDWREKIDVNRLDMCSCNNCIIGQLFGDYADFMSVTNNELCKNNGFGIHDYRELTKEWKNRLANTYDLNGESVNVGKYEVVDILTASSVFHIGQTVQVIKLGGTSPTPFGINNSVMINDSTYYINPLIKVKRVD